MSGKWSVWDEMNRMQGEMDNLFNQMFRGQSAGPRNIIGNTRVQELGTYREALAEVVEKEKEVVATFELPGVEKGDIMVNVTTDGIEVKVERKDAKTAEGEGSYVRKEMYTGYYRFTALPVGLDSSKAEASYKNGVLEVKLPRRVGSERNIKQLEVK
jgi:HSP20 family protein